MSEPDPADYIGDEDTSCAVASALTGIPAETLRALRNETLVVMPAAADDYRTHHRDWLCACEIARDSTQDDEGSGYWSHQIATLNKIAAAQEAPRDGD